MAFLGGIQDRQWRRTGEQTKGGGGQPGRSTRAGK